MDKPTKIEMDGIVNWNRAAVFNAMSYCEFYAVPEEQQCGAWTMVNDARQTLMKATEHVI